VLRECCVIRLGLCDYQEAYSLQKDLLRRRISKSIPDTLVLLQHTPVFTLGRKGSMDNLLVGPEELCCKGIAVHQADRGGDITYHGPGQLVAYPILDLGQHGRDILLVISMYEEVIIRLLAGYGIEGQRIPGCPGVWVGSEKISSVGIGISNWVTYHGFSININTDLEPFSYIYPCGIRDRGITSLSRALGREVDEKDFEERLARAFGEVFRLDTGKFFTPF